MLDSERLPLDGDWAEEDLEGVEDDPEVDALLEGFDDVPPEDAAPGEGER